GDRSISSFAATRPRRSRRASGGRRRESSSATISGAGTRSSRTRTTDGSRCCRRRNPKYRRRWRRRCRRRWRTRTAYASVAEVFELQRKPVIAFLQERDGLLQIVALLSRYAKTVGLDRDLHFHLGRLDVLDDLLGRLGFDAGLDGDLLARTVAGRRFDLSLVEALQRHAALGELAFEHFDGGLDLEVVRRLELKRLVHELDLRVAALEVVALRHFLDGLAERVVDLMPIDLGNYVERRHRSWSAAAQRIWK